jgi:DNA polymerase V
LLTHAYPTDRWRPVRTPRRVPLPLLAGKVAAGFPSPADDYIEVG